MPRPRRLLALLLPLALLGASGGPDEGDLVFTSSAETPGPPHVRLDLDGLDADRLSLGEDGQVELSLPFAFPWYGEAFTAATVSADGSLLFAGDRAELNCPGAGGSWSGLAVFAEDLGAGEVRTATMGRYPYRGFAVEWRSPHALVGGEGLFQAWLLEGRAEAVIVLDDLEFGGPEVDGGAGAIVGAQGGVGTGLSWSCTGDLESGSSAWFGVLGQRPSAQFRGSDSMERVWRGSEVFQYAAERLASGDLDGDGWGDLVVGNSHEAKAFVLLGGAAAPLAGNLDDADGLITSADPNDGLGAGLVVADLDGDGRADLALGAPLADGPSMSNVGGVALFDGDELSGLHSSDEASRWLSGDPSMRGEAGSDLAAGDVDGDGYVDLVVGAPADDSLVTDAGAAFLWRGGADAMSGPEEDLTESPRWTGEDILDNAGTSLAVADFDDDGRADIVVGAPEADGGGAGSGRVYLLAGDASLGGGALVDEAVVLVDGARGSDRAGSALAVGDLDLDGVADLVVGAPYFDDPLSAAGGAFVFLAPLSGGDLDLADADAAVTGGQSNVNLGQSVAVADANGDGRPDLVVGAPNYSGLAAGGGAVGVFTEPLEPSAPLEDAAHLLLGVGTGGSLGRALAVVGGGPEGTDGDGDGLVELWVGAPLDDSEGLDSTGVAYGWELTPDFLDEDGDGFVSIAAGGVDCDDFDDGIFPAAGEVDGNLVDDDCDGWIDDRLVFRRVADWWVHDLGTELDDPPTVSLGFEEARLGDEVALLYQDRGLVLSAGGAIHAAAGVGDNLPVGTLAASFTPTSANRLDLVLDAPVDALALQVLGVEGELRISAFTPDGTLFDEFLVELPGGDRLGGETLGFVFSEGIERLRIAREGTGGFGVDALRLVWSATTDRDLDGFSEEEGDCNDTDAEIHPGAAERLGNGLDDDCDGVVDGGEVDVLELVDDWIPLVGGELEQVDFEEPALGSDPEAFYMDLGVGFTGGWFVVDEVDGAPPRELQAAQASGFRAAMVFEEAQPAIGFTLLDPEGQYTFTASVGGDEVYVVDLDLDLDRDGRFVGLLFDLPVDRLEIEAWDRSETFGIDEVTFAVLGLDDADGDGLTEQEGDCDDNDPSTWPGAEELWYDGVDQDCAGDSDDDADGDGHDLEELGGGDCDDGDPAISPDETEVWYDGIDADCDGLSDYDADADGHESLDWGGDDCDDGAAEVSPEGSETWYDGIDGDCDGSDDYDADADGWVSGVFGELSDLPSGDCDDADGEISPDVLEDWYDGVDSDCSGDGDYDADGDGYDAEATGGDDCLDSDPEVWPGAAPELCYDGIDTDCDDSDDYDCDGDGAASDEFGGQDCDDADPAIGPAATDLPGDGIDTNCDGAAEFDDDGDGYDGVEDGGEDCDDGDPEIHPGALETWYDGVDADCLGDPDGDADGDGYDAPEAGGLDCDDADPTIHPGAMDWYYDGIDSDCDGSMDYDGDGDGFAADWYGGDDCDDEDPAIHPEAADTWYDGVDSDCDRADDFDQDGDGHRAEAHGGGDCDDLDGEVHPGAVDRPGDGLDQDCNGTDDADLDGDGWGSTLDCDDRDPDIHPGAAETWYDGVDGDCSGGSDGDADGDGDDAVSFGGLDCDDGASAVHPGAAETWYDGTDGDCAGDDDYDRDGDGYRAEAWGGGDCDDADYARNPGVKVDACGGGDEDCDELVDEDCVGDGGATDGGGLDGGAGDGGTGDGGAGDGGVGDGGAGDGGAGDGGAGDGGAGDGGAGDGGAGDGGAGDGGAGDGGAGDGGAGDGGVGDGGAGDGGAGDGGTVDGGAGDGGAVDGGAGDGGTVDGGAGDGGTGDGGTGDGGAEGAFQQEEGCGGCAGPGRMALLPLVGSLLGLARRRRRAS